MFFFKILLFLFVSLSLYAGAIGNAGSTAGGAIGGEAGDAVSDTANDLDDVRAFDTWDIWIDDDKPPQEKNEDNGHGDANLSTKITSQKFKISLGSIKDNLNSDDEYETKVKGGDSDHNVKITVVDYDDRDTVLSENAVYWDPTEDKHIDSAEINVTVASKRAKIKMYMCAGLDNDGNVEVYSLTSGDCTDTGDECSFSSTAKFTSCYSSDSFSIRPKYFDITTKENNLTSAKEISFDVKAQNASNKETDQYTTSNSDYDMNITWIRYEYDGSQDNDDSLVGEGNITAFDFTDGNGTITLTYDDIGKVKLTPTDIKWSDIDKDDTPNDCNNNDGQNMGRYICGDVTQTFIPDHFSVNDTISIHNHNDASFTYMSNDTNMSLMAAHLELNVTAYNEQNQTTRNFDISSWVHPLSIRFLMQNEEDINKSMISDVNLSFTQGKVTIQWDETNSSKNLMFNYKRKIDNVKNPFMIKAQDIDIVLWSDYGDINVSDNNGTEVNGDDSNATFVYGKTNAPRTIFKKADTYKVPLYYEIYCYGDECDKTLLPDGENSSTTNDPRWFINTHHNSAFGKAKSITQKRGSGVSIGTDPTGNHQDSVTLKYDGKLPYKTTMQNEAPTWLIYNKYDANADKNEFEIEILDAADDTTSWAGSAEEDVGSTQKVANERANRRIMW